MGCVKAVEREGTPKAHIKLKPSENGAIFHPVPNESEPASHETKTRRVSLPSENSNTGPVTAVCSQVMCIAHQQERTKERQLCLFRHRFFLAFRRPSSAPTAESIED